MRTGIIELGRSTADSSAPAPTPTQVMVADAATQIAMSNAVDEQHMEKRVAEARDLSF